MARPVTERQWQDAVDAAHMILTMELGQLFGLVRVVHEVDIAECVAILEEGRTHGVVPQADVKELRDAVKALLDVIHSRVPVLSSELWLGPELHQLREALTNSGGGLSLPSAGLPDAQQTKAEQEDSQ